MEARSGSVLDTPEHMFGADWIWLIAGALRIMLPRQPPALMPMLPGSSIHCIRSFGETEESHVAASSPTPQSRGARGRCSTARRRWSAGVEGSAEMDALRLSRGDVVSSPRNVGLAVGSNRCGTVRENPRSPSRADCGHSATSQLHAFQQKRIQRNHQGASGHR